MKIIKVYENKGSFSEEVEIKIFSSASEMSMFRYNEFQKLLILESGDLDFVAERAESFIKDGKYDDALIELANLKQALSNVKNGLAYTSMAFACLVSSVAGIACTDITADGLNATLLLLAKYNLSQGEIFEHVEDVKKKSV